MNASNAKPNFIGYICYLRIFECPRSIREQAPFFKKIGFLHFCHICPSLYLLRTWLSTSDISIRTKILFKNILNIENL